MFSSSASFLIHAVSVKRSPSCNSESADLLRCVFRIAVTALHAVAIRKRWIALSITSVAARAYSKGKDIPVGDGEDPRQDLERHQPLRPRTEVRCIVAPPAIAGVVHLGRPLQDDHGPAPGEPEADEI